MLYVVCARVAQCNESVRHLFWRAGWRRSRVATDRQWINWRGGVQVANALAAGGVDLAMLIWRAEAAIWSKDVQGPNARFG